MICQITEIVNVESSIITIYINMTSLFQKTLVHKYKSCKYFIIQSRNFLKDSITLQ